MTNNADINQIGVNPDLENFNAKTFFDQSTQTDDILKSKSTQTAFDINDIASNYKTKIQASLNLEIISDLMEILKDSCLNWNSIQDRIISVIFYMLLRHFKFKYDNIGQILNLLNCSNVKSAHIWSEVIIEEGVKTILVDNRGKYERSDFYEMFPEILTAAKMFSLDNATKKCSAFTVSSLAKFITDKFVELTGEVLQKNELVRSCYSCNVDLIKWGAKWDSNKNRPYFEGHEREDVVAARKLFLMHFTESKSLYYTIENFESKCHQQFI